MATKNLASGTLAESVSASATSLLVYVGNGSAITIKGVWPDTPFYATVMPANPDAGVPNSLDSEIVLVTAVGNDQVGNTDLTVTRAQRGTTAQSFAEGAIVTAGIYSEDAVLLGENGTPTTPAPWVGTDEIEDGAVTSAKLSPAENFVLVDKWRLSNSGDVSTINLSVPDNFSAVEFRLDFCLVNDSSTSEFVRVHFNKNKNVSNVLNTFVDSTGSTGTNTTNMGACRFNAGEMACGSFIMKRAPGSYFYKVGEYMCYSLGWFRKGVCSAYSTNANGLNFTIEINNGTALRLNSGSWATLYARKVAV